MLSKKIEAAFNNQLNAELYSGYLYLSMASWFERMNLKGFAHWLKVQTQEETVHALKFYNYLIDRGAAVKMMAIEGPVTDWETPLILFKSVYKHEQKVTSLINNLMDLALAEKDHASKVFIDWFVNEQVEEESNASQVVEKLKMVGTETSALYVLDKEMGARIFNLPIDMTEWAPGAGGAAA